MARLFAGFFVFFLILSAQVYASVEYISEIGLNFSALGYQEHVPDYPNQSTGGTSRLESNANPSYLSLKSRIEMLLNKNFFGIRAELPISITSVKETWKTDNSAFQTNDMSYAFTNVDLYGGYSFSKIFEMLGGLSIAKGEQTRQNFVVNGALQAVGTSTEIILSTNVFAEVRGNTASKPAVFGYDIGLIYPLSVSTTNNLLPAFNFTASGYTYWIAGNLMFELQEESFIKGEIAYKSIRYDGSGWKTIGTQTAQWPVNDTQDLIMAASWIYSF